MYQRFCNSKGVEVGAVTVTSEGVEIEIDDTLTAGKLGRKASLKLALAIVQAHIPPVALRLLGSTLTKIIEEATK